MDATLADTLKKRRARLAAKIVDGLAYVFNPPPEKDSSRRFKPDPDMFYLTGMTEPDCALVLKADSGKLSEEIVYCRDRDPEHERWNGEMLGPTRTRNLLSIGDARPWKGPAEVVRDVFSAGARSHHVNLDSRSPAVKACLSLVACDKGQTRTAIHDLRWATTRLRMVKDRLEIERISSSCQVTVEALSELALSLPTAKSEAELAAKLDHAYAARGATHAFLPIVASGGNACVAHYIANSARLRKNKMVLVDTGAHLEGYASDVTRVYPVGGRFSPVQRELYGIVHDAQRAAISRIRPGGTMAQAQQSASRVLAKGLSSIGICKGTPGRIMSSRTFAELYFHSIGHMVGIEVHDPFLRTDSRGKPLRLAPGMVVTVEPGLYLDGRKQVPREIRNTGIRIEDTVLVTRTGRRILTEGAPKATREVEGLFS